MKLGKNQKILLERLRIQKSIDISDIKIFNYSEVDKERFIRQLQERNLIQISGTKLIYIQKQETFNYDFSKEKDRMIFYKVIENSRVFKNLGDCIQIEHLGIWHKYFKFCFGSNESLRKLEKKDSRTYKRLYESLLLKIKIKIKETQRNILSWSNKAYQLIYQIDLEKELEKVYLIDVKNRIKFRLNKNHFKQLSYRIEENKFDEVIEESEILAECIYMLFQLVRELKLFALSSRKDYSQLIAI